jgi:hypothetical protein
MIDQESLTELNKVIREIASLYSNKVKLLVEQRENSENSTFSLDDLFELKKVRSQLHLLFQIRDNCQQILYDLEKLRDSSHLLN